MNIYNLYQNRFLIKHDAYISTQDQVLTIETELFFEFFKYYMSRELIGFQLFEVVSHAMPLNDYFCENNPINNSLNNTLEFFEKNKKFKENHTMQLYFYQPGSTEQYVKSGGMDIFSQYIEKQEHFTLTEYQIEECDGGLVFALSPELIFTLLKKSADPLAKSIMSKFLSEKLSFELSTKNAARTIKI